MAGISSAAVGNCSAGKVESPVADVKTIGQQSNKSSQFTAHNSAVTPTITDQDQSGSKLPKKVTELQTSGIVRWNVYESSKNYNRVAGEEVWGVWVMVGSHKTEEAADHQIQIRKDHNHTTNSRNDYGIVHVRWEKRHELVLPANSTVTQDASVTDRSEVNQLQSQVTELQRQVKSLEAKLNLARKQKKELAEEVTELVQENSGFKNGERHQRILGELRQAQFEVQGLRQENQELQNKLQTLASELPMEAVRDRTLNKLKVGKQSAAGKAIDTFIRELKRE